MSRVKKDSLRVYPAATWREASSVERSNAY